MGSPETDAAAPAGEVVATGTRVRMLFPDPGERDEWLRPAYLEVKDLVAYMECKRTHPAHRPAQDALKLAMQLLNAVAGCRDAGRFRAELAAELRRKADELESTG